VRCIEEELFDKGEKFGKGRERGLVLEERKEGKMI